MKHINGIYNILLSIKYSATTFVGYLLARIWNVSLGNNIRFNGLPVFRTKKTGIISIGNNCVFNSSQLSNLIGLHNPCILSLYHRDAKIEIGNNCGFSGTVIRCGLHIKIGDNVKCGANTLLLDTDEHSEDPRAGKDSPIIIDNNVWLGANVTILKGCHIGENSMIGAGSIVTSDIPANSIAVGIPCKVIKPIVKR